MNTVEHQMQATPPPIGRDLLCGACDYILHGTKVCLAGRLITIYSCPSCIVTDDLRA